MTPVPTQPPREPPLVSVVVAARNEERRIGRALRSVLQQTYPSLEVVVVDDGSCDSTADVVIALDDARVRLIRLASSVGRGAARNLAVEQSRGTWIVVQDADDESLPGRVAALVRRAQAGDEPVVVSGQATCVTPGGRSWQLRGYPLADAAVKAELAAGSMSVCHAACMIHRDALLAVGGYDPTCLRAQDLNLMLRLLPLGPLVSVPEVLVRYEHPVRLPYAYWRTSSRFADVARRRARYGSDWRQAPALDPAAVLEGRRPMERLRYAAHVTRRAGVVVRANRPRRA